MRLLTIEFGVQLVACGYTAYFVLHRKFGLDALAAFWLEMALLTPVSLALIVRATNQDHDPRGSSSAAVGIAGVALVGAAAMTAYIAASGLLPTGLFGLLGYAEPVLLLVATMATGIRLRVTDLYVYGPIAAALLLLVIEAASNRKNQPTGSNDNRKEGNP